MHLRPARSALLGLLSTIAVPLAASASPLSVALQKAKVTQSPYALIELRTLPKVGTSPVISKINNLGTSVGYDSQGNLFSPSGHATDSVSGTGFLITADGTVSLMSEIFGQNFIPMAVNDRGQIAGVLPDLLNTPALKVVVGSVGGPLRVVSQGLPSSYDQIFVRDLNNNGSVLLSVTTLQTAPTSTSAAVYLRRTFLASANGSGEYQASELNMPNLSTITTSYTPLLAPTPSDYSLFPQIAGLDSQYLTDSNTVFGTRRSNSGYDAGFRYTQASGATYVYPGFGPVNETTPSFPNYALPFDLGGNDYVLTMSQGVIQILRASDGTLFSQPVGLDTYSAVATSVNLDVLGMLNSHPAVLHPNGAVDDLLCELPQATRIELDSYPSLMNDTGWMWINGRNIDVSNSSGLILLVPNPEAPRVRRNFCATVQASFLDSCANLDRYGTYTFKRGSLCRLAFVVKDIMNRPLAGFQAVLRNGDGTLLQKVRTDKRGRGFFRRRFDPRSGSYSVSAPFADKKYRTTKVDLSVQG